MAKKTTNQTAENAMTPEEPVAAVAADPASKKPSKPKKTTGAAKKPAASAEKKSAGGTNRKPRKPAASKEAPDASEAIRDDSYNRVAYLGQTQAHKTEREEYNEQKELNFAALSRIRDAMYKKEIIRGKITGVSEAAGGISAITFFEGKKVLIPFQDVYINSKLTVSPNESKASLMRRQRQILQTIANCEIEYVIMDAILNEDDPFQDIIRGSRKEALIRLQKRHYDSESIRPGTVHVEEGNIYKGKIIGLGVWGCRVCVYGVDTQITAAEMTYRPIEDLRKLYTPGQDINVYISKIKQDENGNYEVIASCKVAEMEQYSRNVARATIGDMMVARVSAVNMVRDKDGKRTIPRATLFIDAIEMPAYASIIKSDGMRRPLHPGDSVLFRIDGVNPKVPILTGAITRILDGRPTIVRYEN